jgi:Family of unknown function (DUF5677)
LNVFQQKYKKHFELCDEFLSLTLQVLPLIPNPSTSYGEVITAFFIQGLNLFRSAILLCKEGLGYEASLLIRSLLNLSFLAIWTEQEKEERTNRFLGWFCKQRIDYLKSIGQIPTATEQAAWDKVRHLFKDTDRNWYGNTSIRELAASLKEEKPPPDGYRSWAELHYVEAYKPLSDIEHSNPIGSSALLRRAKGRYLIGYLSSDEVIHEALKGGFQYFHRIFCAWNAHFSVVSPETITQLLQTSKEYFQRFEDEEAERKKHAPKAGP